ncbi:MULTISPECIES: four helix bundle protein [unclassified Pseudomonas]|uniref:four helix bundle protein n=1 Tax=unclassified Pseudomonas TaxID=196821 RepID=UPI0038D38139
MAEKQRFGGSDLHAAEGVPGSWIQGLDHPGGTFRSVEGMERRTAKEKVRCLCIAKASCGELRTQIIIGGEVGYLPKPLSNEWITETRELSRMLSGLINKISD